MSDPCGMTDQELIRAAVEASGVSSRAFAECLSWRDERTIRRWSAGEPIPATARVRLIWFLELSASARQRLVTLVTSESPASDV